jgi:hypothetical protein
MNYGKDSRDDGNNIQDISPHPLVRVNAIRFKRELLFNGNCVQILGFRVFSNISLIMFIHQFMIAFVKVG